MREGLERFDRRLPTLLASLRFAKPPPATPGMAMPSTFFLSQPVAGWEKAWPRLQDVHRCCSLPLWSPSDDPRGFFWHYPDAPGHYLGLGSS